MFFVGDTQVIVADIAASIGIIHKIDAVLILDTPKTVPTMTGSVTCVVGKGNATGKFS